jgi:formate hydrogenlyase transcriptional activator
VAYRINRSVKTIPSETANTPVRYDWPSNIRELQNVIERAPILSTGPVLNVPLDDLRARVPSAKASDGGGSSDDIGKMRSVLEDTERRADFEPLLRKQTGSLPVPREPLICLGMKRSTVRGHLQKLGIRISHPAE